MSISNKILTKIGKKISFDFGVVFGSVWLNSLYLFLGRCEDISNPCAQICFNIHHDMYECDCKHGYVLTPDGYNCVKGEIAIDLKENETFSFQ